MNEFAKKWLKQAESDLKAAEHSMASGDYNWSCFQSQQAAEKGLKAFLYNEGRVTDKLAISHLLKELVLVAGNLNDEFNSVVEDAKLLDMFYIPSLYPVGLAGELTPAEYFDENDAKKCIKSSAAILKIVKKLIQ